ncbi:hypothetical protein JCM3765_004960 [Sporobolomyces pararoseus]
MASRRSSISSDDGNHSHQPTTPFAPHRRRSPSITDLTRGITRLGINAHPETPRLPPLTRSRAHPEVPGAPHPDRHHRLMRLQPNARRPVLSSDEVILEHLYPCRPITKHYAKVNSRAAEERYDEIAFEVVPWERESLKGKPFLDQLFTSAVIHYRHRLKEEEIVKWSEVREYGQLENDLIVEADVADAVRVNVLAPLADIFTSFIRPEFQPYLHCIVRGQQNVKDAGKSPGRLDHAIYLVEREPPEGKDYKLQVLLTIIEEKAPGIVRDEDWRPNPSHRHNTDDNWMSRLMPQLFFYSDKMDCSRFFLTNYTDTYRIFIDDETLTEAVKELKTKRPVKRPVKEHEKTKTKVKIQVSCASAEQEHESKDLEPWNFGFKVSLAYDVYEALFGLGIANHKLVDAHLAKEELYGVDEDILEFVKDLRFHATRDPNTPSRRRGSGTYEYTLPPPSPGSD